MKSIYKASPTCDWKEEEYYIGDPCYVVCDDLWDEFCDILHGDKTKEGYTAYHDYLYMSVQGVTIFVCGTAYGDGVYPCEVDYNHVGRCGVDAGLLSIIPMSAVKVWGKCDDVERLGVVIKAQKGYPTYDPNCGAMSWGNMCVDTDPGEADE